MARTKRKSSPAWSLIALIVIVLLVAGGMVAGGLALNQMRNDLVDDLTSTQARTEIERLIGTFLPESASDYYFHSQEFAGESYNARMRFSVAADDFAWLMNEAYNLCFEMPLEPDADDITLPFTSSANLDWWHPETVQNPVGGACTVTGFDYEISVDTSSDETWVVYLAASI